MDYDTTQAVDCLREIFYQELSRKGLSFCELEEFVLKKGHRVLAEALSGALEIFDNSIHEQIGSKLIIHEKKKRTLATTLGTVNFNRRICRDSDNNSVCL